MVVIWLFIDQNLLKKASSNHIAEASVGVWEFTKEVN